MADVINNLSQINFEAENNTDSFIAAAEDRYSFALDCIVERIIAIIVLKLYYLQDPAVPEKQPQRIN